MNNPGVALLLPNFSSLNSKKRHCFLSELDRISPPGTLALTDLPVEQDDTVLDNVKLIKFSHGSDVGDTLRTGFAAALELGAENIVTFEDYSESNAKWFLPYIGNGNIIESCKRGLADMIITEASNLLSFGNMYNGFSMNRLFTREAALSIKDTRLRGKAFLIEAANVLNAKGIKTVEVVKPAKIQSKKRVNPKEVFDSIVNSLNHSSVLFGLFGSLAYLANLIAVYISLSLGWFYPAAILAGGEISAFSNFVMNEKINFKNKGLSSSAYRFGKFNTIAIIPLLVDILLISFLTKYTNIIGKTIFIDLSLITIIFMSTMSIFLVTKFVWSKGNNITIKI